MVKNEEFKSNFSIKDHITLILELYKNLRQTFGT